MGYPIDMDERAREIHAVARSKGFWDHEVVRVQSISRTYYEPNPSIYEEKLMLIVSEVSEVLEARRDENVELEAEECADILIRVFDYMAARGFNPDHEVTQKMAKNRDRPHLHGRER